MGATASAINTENLADEHILTLVNTFQNACFKAALSDVQHCSDDACAPISNLSPEEKMSRLFELADTNHDGKLDEGEISVLLHKLDLEDDVVSQLDTHLHKILKKGSNSTFSFVLNQFLDLMNPAKAVQCVPPLMDGEPKRVVFVGVTGSGKSSLCTSLTGQSPEKSCFEIGESASSMTVVCSRSQHKWFGEEDKEEFVCVDTPGLDDELGRDDEHINSIITELKTMEYINAVVLVLNSENTRFSTSLQKMIKEFEKAFDPRFYSHTVVVLTKWYLDKRAKSQRKKKKRTEETVAKELNAKFVNSPQLRVNFEMPIVCVDSFYNDPETYEEDEIMDGRTRMEAIMNKIPNGKFRTADINTVKPKLLSMRGLENARLEVGSGVGCIIPIQFDKSIEIKAWKIEPDLPAGMSIVDTKSGALGGTPSVISPPTMYELSCQSIGGWSNILKFDLSVNHSIAYMKEIVGKAQSIQQISESFDCEKDLPETADAIDSKIESEKISLQELLQNDIVSLQGEHSKCSTWPDLENMLRNEFDLRLSQTTNAYRQAAGRSLSEQHERDNAIMSVNILIAKKTKSVGMLNSAICRAESFGAKNLDAAQAYLVSITPGPCIFKDKGCSAFGTADDLKQHQPCCLFGQGFQYLRRSELKYVMPDSAYDGCKVAVRENQGLDKKVFDGEYKWHPMGFYLYSNEDQESFTAIRRKDGNGTRDSDASHWELCTLKPEDGTVDKILDTSNNDCKDVKDADFKTVEILLSPCPEWIEIERNSSIFKEQRLQASSLKLLYFGGMWCPYCPPFTAILKVFYERVRELKGADAIDVIFISSDKTIKDQAKYYDSHHADWLVVPYNEKDGIKRILNDKYEVTGIPTCTLVNDMMKRIDDEDVDGKDLRRMLNSFPKTPGPLQDASAIEIYDKLRKAVTDSTASIADDESSGKCDIFISLRYAEAEKYARQIVNGLKEKEPSINTIIIDAEVGENIAEKVANSIDESKLCLIMGSKTYGQETASTFSTYEELEYIKSEKKPIFLVKMCERFEVPTTRLKLNNSISFFYWDTDKLMPDDLIPKIMDSFTKAATGNLSVKQ